MLTYLQAVVLGAVQGIAELFPVSSLGHSVILPGLLGWHINQGADSFLSFLVVIHFATALVLFIFFWKDWKRIIAGFFRSVKRISVAGDPDARLAWLLVWGTVPAGLIGLAFQSRIQSLLAAPAAASIILIFNGLLLLAAESLRRRPSASSASADAASADARLAALSAKKSFGIGIVQALALLPGISRTGASLGGGLLAGLDREDAARFAFLLATPIIGAAALLKLPHVLLHLHSYPGGAMLAGAVAAGLCAWGSTSFLMRYFKTRTLFPFALYCVVAGSAAAAFYLFA